MRRLGVLLAGLLAVAPGAWAQTTVGSQSLAPAPTQEVRPATGLFGAIAEEVDALGLTDLVSYGQDGLPENVRYERIALYLIPLIQEQRTEIEGLKTQLSALEARLAALEQRAKPCEGPECLR